MRRDKIFVNEIPFQVIICVIDIFLPILGVILNIRTVNFRKYLKSLMKGVGKEMYFLEASIFIYRRNKSNEAIEDDDSKETSRRSMFQFRSSIIHFEGINSSNKDFKRDDTMFYRKVEDIVSDEDTEERDLYQKEFKKLKNSSKKG